MVKYKIDNSVVKNKPENSKTNITSFSNVQAEALTFGSALMLA